MTYKLKTTSVWGGIPPRFFRFLDMITEKGMPKTLCVIGCSDGRYVIPAAKRGFRVRAIDIDMKAIFGGIQTIKEKNITMEGLFTRIYKEGVSNLIEVVPRDFMKDKCKKRYSGVFTSGSIHYRENEQYSPQSLINKIKSYVSLGGILLLEYIHRSESRKDPFRYYFTKGEMENLFRDNRFKITSHKVKRYLESPNPRNPLIHEIEWARLYATRLK
jgi:hypothetical protein